MEKFQIQKAFYVSIPKKILPQYELAVIKNNLKKYTRDYITNQEEVITYYYENNERIQIPFFYPFEYEEYLKNKNIELEDIRTEGAPFQNNVSFNKGFQYREKQEDLVRQILEKEISILIQSPGSGKTIIGAASVLHRKVRTLIIVDQDNLKDQWIRALEIVSEKGLSISDDFLKEMTSEMVIGDDASQNKNRKKEIKYFDIYITTIQNIIAKIRLYGLEKVQEYYKRYDIGYVILDECHVLIGPERFSLFGHVCNSKYILALTATPRKDIYFDYWLGENKIGLSEYNFFPNIVRCYVKCDIDKSRKYIFWNDRFHKDRYAIVLYKNVYFLEYISSIIYKAFKKNRKIAVLCNYNKYGVFSILKYLKEKYNFDDTLIGCFIAKAKKDEEISKKIILSNYKMLQKGTDIPDLDTLVLADTIYSEIGLEQAIGRILRKHENKKELLVFDIRVDDFKDIFKKKEREKDKFFLSKNFKILV